MLRETINVEDAHLSSIIRIVSDFHKWNENEKGQDDDACANEEHVRVDGVGRSLTVWPWQRNISSKAVDTSCDDQYLCDKIFSKYILV